MKKRQSLYKLFTFYSSQERIRRCGIYRYRFQNGNNSFKEVYKKAIEVFKLQNRGHYDIDSVLIVQTTSNRYYFTIFFCSNSKDYIEYIKLFENWLGESRYEKYVEDCKNTSMYDCVCGDVGIADNYRDEPPRYSYWNWVYDMSREAVERYILFDRSMWHVDIKNMYLWHEGLLQLSKEPNFYNIYFDYVTVPGDNEEVYKVLIRNKEETLDHHLKNYKEIMENKPMFKEYWMHIPDETSYIQIEHISLIDLSINLNLEVYHTNIELPGDKKSQFESVYDMYNSKFHIIHGLEAVFMFKPKSDIRHKIIFLTRYSSERLREQIETTIRLYNSEAIVSELESLEYDFYIPENVEDEEEDNFRQVRIWINSMVIGIYSRNIKVCYNLSTLINSGLINGDQHQNCVDHYQIYESKGWTFKSYLKRCKEYSIDPMFYSKEDMGFMRNYSIYKQALFVRLGEA